MFTTETDATGAGVFPCASKVEAHRQAVAAGAWCNRAGYAATVEHGPGCRVKVFVPGCLSGWCFDWPVAEGAGMLTYDQAQAVAQ